MSVLVVGAAGQMGRRVVAALLDLDTEVVALVPSREDVYLDGSPLADSRVRIVPGGLADPDSVLRAAVGCGSIFLPAPRLRSQMEQQQAAVDAAAAVGARVVMLSSWTPMVSCDTTVADARRHWLLQQYIGHRQVPCTVLGPNFLQQNLLDCYADVIRRDGVLPAPSGDYGISMVDARDVAEVAARALVESEHVGMTYTLSGPRAYRFSEIAAMIGELTGRPVRHGQPPLSTVPCPCETEHTRELFELYRQGAGELVTDDVRKVTGHPARPLEEFLGEVRDSFIPLSGERNRPDGNRLGK